jgi:hypothetical protein
MQSVFYHVILHLMALGFRGRPRREAVLPMAEDPGLFYYDRFYEACDTLSYSDCVSLANGLKISVREVYNWRNRRHFPCMIGTALFVMDWVRLGKPTKLVSQDSIMTSML